MERLASLAKVKEFLDMETGDMMIFWNDVIDWKAVYFRDDIFNFQRIHWLWGCGFFEDIISSKKGFHKDKRPTKQSGSELFYHQPLCGRIPVTGLHFPMFASTPAETVWCFFQRLTSPESIEQKDWTSMDLRGDLRQALSQGRWPSLLHSGSNPSNDALTAFKIYWVGCFWKQWDHILYWDLVSFQGKPHSKCWTNLPFSWGRPPFHHHFPGHSTVAWSYWWALSHTWRARTPSISKWSLQY